MSVPAVIEEGASQVPGDEIIGRTPWQLFWFRFKRERLAIAAALFIIFITLVAILAPLITDLLGHPPNQLYNETLDQEYGLPAVGPSGEFLFGVDSLGEDVFSRVVYGARASLEVALLATAFAVLIGTPLGMIAGYYRGVVDSIVSRIVDVTLCFPVLLLALGVASACSLGNGCAGGLIQPGIATVTAAIVVYNWTYIARIVRGQVLSLREREFVEAARATGARDSTIIFREILPNLVSPLIIYATLIIPQNMLLEAALSFLGVGIQAPTASWGQMISDSTQVFDTAWWFFAFPGFALLLTVLAFNLLGDGIRDALDPRIAD